MMPTSFDDPLMDDKVDAMRIGEYPRPGGGVRADVQDLACMKRLRALTSQDRRGSIIVNFADGEVSVEMETETVALPASTASPDIRVALDKAMDQLTEVGF